MDFKKFTRTFFYPFRKKIRSFSPRLSTVPKIFRIIERLDEELLGFFSNGWKRRRKKNRSVRSKYTCVSLKGTFARLSQRGRINRECWGTRCRRKALLSDANARTHTYTQTHVPTWLLVACKRTKRSIRVHAIGFIDHRESLRVTELSRTHAGQSFTFLSYSSFPRLLIVLYRNDTYCGAVER